MSTITEAGATTPEGAEPSTTQEALEFATGTGLTASTEHEQEAQGDESREGGAGAEAARYRRQLRSVEAERDGLREQLAAAHRREVDRLASVHLAVAADLFTIGGVDLADLVDAHGMVDEQAVLAAATALLETRPGLAAGLKVRTSPPNHGAGYRPTAGTPELTWHRAIRGDQ